MHGEERSYAPLQQVGQPRDRALVNNREQQTIYSTAEDDQNGCNKARLRAIPITHEANDRECAAKVRCEQYGVGRVPTGLCVDEAARERYEAEHQQAVARIPWRPARK